MYEHVLDKVGLKMDFRKAQSRKVFKYIAGLGKASSFFRENRIASSKKAFFPPICVIQADPCEILTQFAYINAIYSLCPKKRVVLEFKFCHKMRVVRVFQFPIQLYLSSHLFILDSCELSTFSPLLNSSTS